MRNYETEIKNRTKFIKETVDNARADGIVFANSGGKDCVLSGILCKMACSNTLGLILPCSSKRNYNEDMEDAKIIATQFDIETRIFDLAEIRSKFFELLESGITLNKIAESNIPPRLRMVTLYAVAASENRLVAGTGNRSERYMGYFTKFGDGACDFNPIADLTVTEIYEFLRFLNVPEHIISKPPSAGLFEGQTDEQEMGITYANIDNFLINGIASEEDRVILNKFHSRSEHKRNMPNVYSDDYI